MDKGEFQAIVEEIYEKFKSYGVARKEIESRLKLLLFEFKVPKEEAKKTIINGLRKNYNISKGDLKPSLTKISEIEPNRWVSLKAKVIQLWEPNSPAIAQTGLIGDETGTARFVVWSKANKKRLEEGKCYLFDRVVIDEFMGVKSVKVTSASDVKEIPEEIEVKEEEGEVEVIGALVTIQQNSGLLQTCKICGRVVKAGLCVEHGKVETNEILRLKGVLDDGERIYDLTLDEKCVSALTGIGLREARKIAEEHLDRSVVLLDLKKRLLGKYLRVYGELKFRSLNASRVEFYKPKILEEVEKVLEEEGT
ncbi:MAG: replication protein A [Archaeoglobaceae archaeon]|nr:replication protein A [Archaeoglobaceae archaeon]MDW8118216.1 replication protein A [Archaeoglobaceae archaeon]